MRWRSSLARSISRRRDSTNSEAERWLSLTIAPRHGVVSAATAMYSCVLRALWVIECRTKGPTLFAVSHTAMPAAKNTASVAPRWPKRNAAQIRAGNTRYETGRGLDRAIALRPTTAVTIAAASNTRLGFSRARLGLHSVGQACAHTRIKGSTTSAPVESPIQIVRQILATSPVWMVPSTSSVMDPTVALIAVAAAIAISIRPIWSRRSKPALRPTRRQSRTVATVASARLAAVIRSSVSIGEPPSLASRSPITTPGHQRRPPRYSTATARPTGGQIAAIEPVNWSA